MKAVLVAAAVVAPLALAFRDVPAWLLLRAGAYGALERIGPDRYLGPALAGEPQSDVVRAWAQRRLGALFPNETVDSGSPDGHRLWVATRSAPDRRRLWLLAPSPWRALDGSAPLETGTCVATVTLGDLDGDGVNEAMLAVESGTAAVGHLFRRTGDSLARIPSEEPDGGFYARHGFALGNGTIRGWSRDGAGAEIEIRWSLDPTARAAGPR